VKKPGNGLLGMVEMNENSLNSVMIIPKKKAMTILRKVIDGNSLCYYLTEDYASFVSLQNELESRIKIRSLGRLFDKTLQEMKEPVLELLSGRG